MMLPRPLGPNEAKINGAMHSPSPPRTYYLGTGAFKGPLRTYYLGTWGARVVYGGLPKCWSPYSKDHSILRSVLGP